MLNWEGALGHVVTDGEAGDVRERVLDPVEGTRPFADDNGELDLPVKPGRSARAEHVVERLMTVLGALKNRIGCSGGSACAA